jgi:snurportin-1
MPQFPSILPANTILDCILDEHWHDNGILHILDVLKWNGQDVADCETPFRSARITYFFSFSVTELPDRFWWRDTRLSELPHPQPLVMHPHPPPSGLGQDPQNPTPLPQQTTYRCSYPTTLLPIPYHTNLTLTNLSTQIVPLARSVRTVNVMVAIPINHSSGGGALEEEMDTEDDRIPPPREALISTSGSHASSATTSTVEAHIQPDGLLLYVAEASYESGTSPLSSWVPIEAYEPQSQPNSQGLAINGAGASGTTEIEMGGTMSKESPLDKFLKYVSFPSYCRLFADCC